MKKKVTLLVAAIMVLATIAAYAGATTTVDLNVNVTLPTYLSMNLTDTSDKAVTQWNTTADVSLGNVTSDIYKLTVVCNDTWKVTAELVEGALQRTEGTGAADGYSTGSGSETLTLLPAFGTTQTLSFTGATPLTATPVEVVSDGDMTASTIRYCQFRVPYTMTNRAGIYTGTIRFKAVSP